MMEEPSDPPESPVRFRNLILHFPPFKAHLVPEISQAALAMGAVKINAAMIASV